MKNTNRYVTIRRTAVSSVSRSRNTTNAGRHVEYMDSSLAPRSRGTTTTTSAIPDTNTIIQIAASQLEKLRPSLRSPASREAATRLSTNAGRHIKYMDSSLAPRSRGTTTTTSADPDTMDNEKHKSLANTTSLRF
ncbi:uncharacterized protein LOC125238714 [Leguminivora glycinivorella]|uniref:uncharacterized protein LOC125238714 n=1 Tax=Leguminivora glycinivorella TaxID=1035111 RepID=UPI00200F7980|nr:uncharacterized protein LOC125238714 [Leguminivora glycinivorella]